MDSTKSKGATVRGLVVTLLITCGFLVGVVGPTGRIPRAAAIPPANDSCSRCRGSSTDGPDNRCISSTYGGDFCAGNCDELNLCTCREVGDCDGYGSGS